MISKLHRNSALYSCPGELKQKKNGRTRKPCRSLVFEWWAMTGLNRRHPACKAGALPTELIALGDPWGNRTPVNGVKGRCLDRLTKGPYLVGPLGLEPRTYRL
jgi:hypothetical protein